MKATHAVLTGIARLTAEGRVTERGTIEKAIAAPLILDDISESEFQRQVVYYARRQRWLVYHTFDSRRSAAGFPDLVMVRGHRLIFAELKASNGRLTADQVNWLSDLWTAGQTVYCWRPSEWSEIIEILK